MTRERSRFAGGDQTYLREQQYRDPSRLAKRADLHRLYSTATVPWFEWVAGWFEIDAGASVLEVGCGPGWMWEQSAHRLPGGVDLTLSDLSPGMVDVAVDRARATEHFRSVTGHHGDAQALPFDAEQFDLVIANHMLYHLPDPAAGVAELARVVRRSGSVVVATNGQHHLRELKRIDHEVFGVAPIDAIVEAFGAESGFPLLRRGFGDVSWHQYIDAIRCDDPAAVLDYLCSAPPGEDATPEELVRLRAAIDAAIASDGGAMTITKDTGCFVCRRPVERA